MLTEKQIIELRYRSRKISVKNAYSGVYASYRFSTSSNYISFNEYKIQHNIGGLYISAMRHNAIAFLKKQIEAFEYLEKHLGLKYNEEKDFYESKLAKITKKNRRQ